MFCGVPFCVVHSRMEGKTAFLCVLCKHNTLHLSSFWLFRTLWKLTGLFRCKENYVRRMLHTHLVTEVEPTWSNSICIAPCPYPTNVRYNSKYFNLCRIIFLSIWYQNLSVSLERVWGIAVIFAFALEHTVKQEGPVSIAETVLFFFHIHVSDFCKASCKKLRFQFWYNQQNVFNTNGIYCILTKNILMFWV